MKDIDSRFYRFQKLLSPDAHETLVSTPGLVDRLEHVLEDGADLPLVIDRSHLENLGLVGMSDIDDIVVKGGSGDDAMDNIPLPRSIGPHPIWDDAGACMISDRRTEVPPGPSPRPTPMIKLPPSGERVKASTGDLADIHRSVSETIKFGGGSSLRADHLSGPGGRPRPLAAEYEGDLRVIKDPTSSMGGKSKIDDFRTLFLDRYRTLRDILLLQYGAISPCQDIDDLRSSEEEVRFIGIVESIRTTKNGHRMVNIEDPTGSIRVLLSKNKRDTAALSIVNDEVIGIVGKFRSGDTRGGAIVFADAIYKVDIPIDHRRRLSDVRGLAAAFTSDIHIGSRMYLDKEWRRMIRWLRGEIDASLPGKDGTRVKYLVIAGDLVDGIGTYPDQDKDLLIKDIFKQYEALGESLSSLPDHIHVIMIPGNHDAVRIAEPQPPLPREFQDCFSNSHLHFLSNPAFFSIHGVHVAGYHGKSIDDLVTLFRDVTYENPIEGMKEMLRFRHFCPTYGMRNQISPEERDNLVIDDVPDIFVSGHVHRFGMDNYKGVQLIEGSAWQSQTPFQRLMNLKPQPGRMGIVELDLPNTMHAWELT
ncbi:MAG: DNA-directed DNA polymerase II small subunit [Candidatus Thermoplasmatota archaeon]|nr:DNA-directed DNA polymerase II small subunit [Candidatus Thermoplasmatota archaeon]